MLLVKGHIVTLKYLQSMEQLAVPCALTCAAIVWSGVAKRWELLYNKLQQLLHTNNSRQPLFQQNQKVVPVIRKKNQSSTFSNQPGMAG